MPLAVVLLALLIGALGDVDAAGRTFVVSAVDVAAAGIAVAGAVVAWRRRRIRVDPVILAYAGLLLIVLLQLPLRPDDAAILGGASRFVTPLLLVLGLSQLVPDVEVPWRWPAALAGLGMVVAAWSAVLVGAALLDPARGGFYAVKNAIDLPLGASNYVAAFVLVPAAVAGAHALSDRRWRLPAAVLAAGVAVTLSRGAVLALAVTAAAGLALAAPWRRAARIAAGVVAVVVLAAGLTLAVRGVSVEEADPASSDPAQRLALYEAAWDAFADEPVLGHGLNRFQDVSVSAELASPHVNAHNLELHALATTGLAGLVAYLAIWGTLVRRAWRLAPGPVRTALLLGPLALFLHAQVEALAYTRSVEALMAVFVVLAGAAGDSLADVRLPLPTRPRQAR